MIEIVAIAAEELTSFVSPELKEVIEALIRRDFFVCCLNRAQVFLVPLWETPTLLVKNCVELPVLHKSLKKLSLIFYLLD